MKFATKSMPYFQPRHAFFLDSQCIKSSIELLSLHIVTIYWRVFEVYECIRSIHAKCKGDFPVPLSAITRTERLTEHVMVRVKRRTASICRRVDMLIDTAHAANVTADGHSGLLQWMSGVAHCHQTVRLINCNKWKCESLLLVINNSVESYLVFFPLL